MKQFSALLLISLVLCLQSFSMNIAYVTGQSRGAHGYNLSKVMAVGDRCDVYSEKGISLLCGKLKDYDAVVLQLYFEKTDWKVFGTALKGWLEQGGVLVATGAECDEIVRQLYGQFGKDWTLNRTSCILGRDQQKILKYSLGQEVDGAVFFPYDVRADMCASQGWAHYTDVSAGWTVIGRCPKGHPSILKRPLGRGMVYSLVNHSPNNMPGKSSFWYRFVKNGVIQTRFRELGIRLSSCSYSASFGPQCLTMAFRNRSDLDFKVDIRLGDKVLASRSVRLPPTGTFELPYVITEGGILDLRLTIGTGVAATALSFQRPVLLPLVLRSGFLSYRPSIKHVAPFRLEADPVLARRGTLRFEVDGKPLKKVTFGFFPRPCVADLSALAPGSHRARVVLAMAGRDYYATPELTFLVDKEDPPLMVDSEGFFVRRGKRSFPIGLYTHYLVTKGCGYLAQHGFDVMGAEYWQPKRYDLMNTLTADALAHDMMVILCGFPHIMKDKVTKGTIPADRLILEFGDEPDLSGTTPEQALREVRGLRNIAPGAPTFMCLCMPLSLDGRYNGTTDIIAHDSYPVPKGTLSDVYVSLSQLTKQLEGWCRMPAAVPQCFGYPGHPKTWWPTLPTPEEMRNMYFQALVAGVKGLRFYVWADGSFNIEEHPKMEKALMDFVRWVRRHEAFLLSGDQRELPAEKDSRVYGREWRASGKVLRIYVNASKEECRSHGLSFQPREVKILMDGQDVSQ